MLQAFKRLFGSGDKPKGDAHYLSAHALPPGEEEIPRYPPFVRGLPLCPPKQILETQEELIARIRGTLGLAKHDHESLILPLIESCAAFVHLLPASEAHHHRGAGGLFRHSLEVGAWAAQFAEGRIFSFGKSPLERKQEDPRWVVATFAAAFAHDIGKAASDMAIVSPDGSVEWNPYLESLWDWGQRNKLDRYFVRWRENRHKKHEQTGLLLVNQIMPTALKAWLGGHNPEIIQRMMEATACKGEHLLTQLVVKADSTSVERDVKTNRTLGTEVSVGVPVERHLLDASRRLISNGTWTVNKKGSRVWVTREGVFIVWKLAAEEIVALLSEDRIPGIPRDKDTLADLLLDRELALWNAEEDPEHRNRYWAISPAVLDGRSGPLWLQCIKLSDVELLFSSEPPAPAKIMYKGPKGEQVEVDGAVGSELAVAPAPAANNEADADEAAEHAPKPKPREKDQAAKAKQSEKPGMRLPEASTNQVDISEPAQQLELPVPATEATPSNKPVQRATKEVSEAETAETTDAPANNAQAWLKEQKHEAADLLHKMLHDVGMGIKPAAELFGEEDGLVYLRYPDAVRPYGRPADVSQWLSKEGWLVADPENPMRKARQMSEGRGLVLSAPVADQVRMLLTRRLEPAQPKEQPKPAQKTVVHQQDSEKQAANVSQPHEAKPIRQEAEHKRDQGRPAAERPAHIGDRPPPQSREFPEEILKVVEAFVIEVRSGRIPSTIKMHQGVQHHEVGAAYMSRFVKPHNPGLARAAFTQREGCFMTHLHCLVVAE